MRDDEQISQISQISQMRDERACAQRSGGSGQAWCGWLVARGWLAVARGWLEARGKARQTRESREPIVGDDDVWQRLPPIAVEVGQGEESAAGEQERLGELGGGVA